MKTLAFLLLSAAAFAQPVVSHARFETRPYSGDLAAQIRAQSPAWFGYGVKSMSKDNMSCCWNSGNQCGCRLEGGEGNVTIGSRSGQPVQLEGATEMAVLLRVAGDGVEKVRVFSLGCPLDAGGLPFIWITNVPANASLSYLQRLVKSDERKEIADGAIFAIAQHDDARVDAILDGLAQPGQPDEIRDKAIFWMGAARGAAGLKTLQNLVEHDPSEHIRNKAIFAISINKQPESIDVLIHAAHDDSSAHIRGQALFWLAQKAGARAVATIANAIENDPDTEVKKKAVFALSQLPKDEGVPKLIQVARTQRNPEVRKQAFFWLGQSGDPRALDFIEQVLR